MLDVRQAFDMAMDSLKRGDAVQARGYLEQGLSEHPENVNLNALYGGVLLQSKDYEAAEKVLRKSLGLAPTFAKPHEDLGYLYIETRRPEQAIPLLQRAIELAPDVETAHFQLGRALVLTGRGKDADVAFERSFALSPERREMALAAEHHREGRFNEAERMAIKLLHRNEENVDALRILGLVCAGQARPEEAERHLSKALDLAPDFIELYAELGRVYKELEKFDKAITMFEKWVEFEPNNPKAHFLLGSVYSPASYTEKALACYQRSIELHEPYPAVWLGLGHVLKTLGRQQEGIDAYKRCIELKPENGETYWSLANLKTYKFDDEMIAQMEAMIEREDVREQSLVNFLFSLAKAYEDRKDYEKAWQYYARGNATQRELVSYDPIQNEVYNREIIDVFDADMVARLRELGGCNDAAPIFVLGLPRSGSTLIEQILASHSQVEGTSELAYMSRIAHNLSQTAERKMRFPKGMSRITGDHLMALGERYLEWADRHRHTGRPFFIDKMPNNFPFVGLIKAILPNAKIIDARRHPLDACVGNLKQLFAKGQAFTYDEVDIGEYYLSYIEIMDHWHKVFPGEILTVQYEDNVFDNENQIRRILDFCGLPFEESCLRFYETDRAVRTASSEQVRQPIYTGSVHQYKRFEPWLGTLKEVLEPVLTEEEMAGPASDGI